jgi:TonB-linked SusC/RagA family outer membrane protein
MKLTAILLLVGCLQLSARGISQTITLSVKDADLQTVFTAIEKQTDYVFFVRKQLLQNAKRVTITVSGASLQQVLDLCFKDQPFTYLIAGKMITISRRAEKASVGTTIQTTNQDGQLVDVKGRVVNENNDPVEGVNVNVKGTAITTSTNVNGEFGLKGVDENGTLVFTSVSVEPFEVKVKGRAFLDVAVQTKITSMQEVVINKGYYTEKKMLATGNVVTIKAKDIEKQPVNNPLLALVGRVPGVTIEQQTGFANSGIVVRIQGRNSISSGLDPLYVIDGVPYLSQSLPTVGASKIVLGNSGGGTLTGGGNPLSLINPNDIESIDILKDADATAIYGSRGANGVILITTKRGKAGRTKVTTNFRTGWGKVAKKMDLLDTEQYLEMRKEAYKNDGLPVPDQSTIPSNSNYDLTVYDQNRYTDWQKVLIGRTAKYTDLLMGISGGSANTQFAISSGYHKETTVFPGDFSDKKVSFQFNVTHTSTNQKFKLQTSCIYVIDNNQIPSDDLTMYAMKLPPNSPALYNNDGTLNWASVTLGAGTVSTWINPLSFLYNQYSNKANNLIGNTQLSYQLFSGFTVSSRLGYNNQQYNDISLSTLSAIRPELRTTSDRSSTFGNGNSSSWIIEPQATYNLKVGRGKIEALIGSSFQQNTIKSQPVTGRGYSSDLLLKNLRSASTVSAGTPVYSLYKYNAWFGRLNYNFNDRYILNATVRRDGSSRFGSENLFNNFWSVAGSWVFTNEDWFANNLTLLNFGKLRVSYGTSGNEQIGDYGFINLYNTVSAGVPYQGITAMAPDRLTNPYLQWEETRKLQFGLDMGLLHDRIVLNLNYYHNRSSNLLTRSNLSIITGFSTVTENFQGVVQNKGWEITLSTLNYRSKKFSWNTNINFTIPQHNGRLVSFPDIANTFYANTYTVGKSLYDMRMFHYLGIDPSTGKYQVSDVKGNITYSPTVMDMIAFSNLSERLYGGLQNNISYKGLDLDFTFQFVRRNASDVIGDYPGRFSAISNSGNQPEVIMNRWQNPGNVTNIQKFSATYPSDVFNSLNNFTSSDGYTTDASFIRLTNLAVSWELQKQWPNAVHIYSFRIFLQGQNLLTITKYKGLDPSTGSSITLPPLRLIAIGANVTF